MICLDIFFWPLPFGMVIISFVILLWWAARWHCFALLGGANYHSNSWITYKWWVGGMHIISLVLLRCLSFSQLLMAPKSAHQENEMRKMAFLHNAHTQPNPKITETNKWEWWEWIKKCVWEKEWETKKEKRNGVFIMAPLKFRGLEVSFSIFFFSLFCSFAAFL